MASSFSVSQLFPKQHQTLQVDPCQTPPGAGDVMAQAPEQWAKVGSPACKGKTLQVRTQCPYLLGGGARRSKYLPDTCGWKRMSPGRRCRGPEATSRLRWLKWGDQGLLPRGSPQPAPSWGEAVQGAISLTDLKGLTVTARSDPLRIYKRIKCIQTLSSRVRF